jgi:hypothetical protein
MKLICRYNSPITQANNHDRAELRMIDATICLPKISRPTAMQKLSLDANVNSEVLGQGSK